MVLKCSVTQWRADAWDRCGEGQCCHHVAIAFAQDSAMFLKSRQQKYPYPGVNFLCLWYLPSELLVCFPVHPGKDRAIIKDRVKELFNLNPYSLKSLSVLLCICLSLDSTLQIVKVLLRENAKLRVDIKILCVSPNKKKKAGFIFT